MGKIDFGLGQASISANPCICSVVEYTAPVGGGDVTIDRATLLTAISAKITDLGYTAPTGTTLDLQNATVAAYSKGTTVTDEGTDVETITVAQTVADVTCGGQVVNVNPFGGKKPFGVDHVDVDCDGDSDLLLSADFQVVIPEGGAVAIGACVTAVNP